MTAHEEGLARVPFWFLRHGETDWNARNLSQGNIDIPLNPTGLAQARSAAELLRNRGVDTIVTSPLSRARVTAEIAAEALGCLVVVEDGLRERAVAAVNRATAHPPAVLVVAHGALFRALRSAMGLDPYVRTRNAVPFWCEPGADGAPWELRPAVDGMAMTMANP